MKIVVEYFLNIFNIDQMRRLVFYKKKKLIINIQRDKKNATNLSHL